MSILIGILGLALLMVIHEGGHMVAARAFKMRVVRFSIGFGPALWRYQPRGSETIFQVALIPFLAYVQIAGMNPLEEIDPSDQGSYANASLIGRISAIFAGPLANYLFASVLFFAAFMIGGEVTKIQVMKGGAAVGISFAGTFDSFVRFAESESRREILSNIPVLTIDLAARSVSLPAYDVDFDAKGILVVSVAGGDVEVIDLRTIKPLDIATVITTVKKTHFCLLVEEGHLFAGISAEVGFQIQEHCFDYLDAPLKRVCQKETPLPYSKALERESIPNTGRVIRAIEEVLS